ncbi:hypothetical protein CAPTEDRAFT_206037 [Capitella teleta]|uniref:Uncharacterized protein n=1 Tax=Capitella teleta TaxID=283909 RepID=R7UQP4_CAPTE|nr:hypothetical protein CAPTEDRAFT_206037 [Capitella teleta]|eukprot:ELU08849.1 hypothetical protein CAPTEDRAFT_206037 [Capitella teleta]
MDLAACGFCLLTTIIEAPVVIGLDAAADAKLACGVASKFVSRRLAVRAQKHDEIHVLAESKANSIASHVSAALQDGNVSDKEVKLIIEEVERYKQMKAHLRAGARKKHTKVKLDQEKKKMLSSNKAERSPRQFHKKS